MKTGGKVTRSREGEPHILLREREWRYDRQYRRKFS